MTRASSAPSLADVAREAGVSPATASRALNNTYGVSDATRRRVVEVARRLDFVASPAASSLASGSTNRVALVVPHIERWFFGEMVSGIERVLSAADLDLVLYHVDDPGGRRAFFELLPARRKVDAVVVVAFPVDTEEQARLELMGVYIVAAGGQSAHYPYAGIDDYTAGRTAVDHLIGLGHRGIAMIAGADPFQPAWPEGSARTRAYIDALADAGVVLRRELVRNVAWRGAVAAEAMEQILDAGQRPTAVYAHSDELALGAVRTLRRRGLRVPEDVSVIGVDDHPLAELTDLTTVRQPVRAQGAAAARMVLRALGRPTESPVVGDVVLFPTELVVRRSTAAPRSS